MGEIHYALEWSPRAKQDLRCLDCHTERLDEAAQALLAATIYAQAQVLIAFPEIGRSLLLLGANWRQLPRNPYRIIYFVEHSLQTVFISRIWHSSRAEPTEEDLIPLR